MNECKFNGNCNLHSISRKVGHLAIILQIILPLFAHAKEPLVEILDNPGNSTRITENIRSSPVANNKPIASIQLPDGRLSHFFQNELQIVTRQSQSELERRVRQWNGTVIQILREGDPDGTTYLVRIDTNLPDNSERRIDSPIRERGALSELLLRASSPEARRVLIVADALNAVNGIKAEPHWIKRGSLSDELSAEKANKLNDLLNRNCGQQLLADAQSIQNINKGGIREILQESALLENRSSSENCRTLDPEVTLVPNQQLVLPEGTSDKSYRVIIKPPVNLEQITHARLVDENGNERVLYGGSLTLGGPVNGKLGLRTSTAGNKLPRCALTEQFIIRLTHRRGDNREIDADFQVKLPIQLSPIRFGTLPNYGSYQFHLNPGEASNIPQMCAGGDPANRNWTWVNDPDPLPAGLGMQVNNDGSNRITGTPQTNSYRGQGLIQLSQGVSQVTTRVSLEVGVRYFEQFGDTPLCGSQIDLEPGGFYECEMPQPRNYPSYTWTINSGRLPPGLQIMQRDQTKWYITGTIDANTPVRTFPVNFQISSSQQALDRRQVNFVVGIPIKVWTQNAQLRPNITDNTDADNEERASLILNRINNGEFDVVALQEVFDNTQRDQLEIGHSRLTAQNPGYRLLWGPATEESGLCEESGLALLVKNKPGPLRDDSQPFVHRYSPRFEEPTHSGSEFPISCGMKLPIPIPNRTSQQQFCEWDDCLAYKGFTITKAFFGENTNEYLWIVHTHLQASEADGQREQQRGVVSENGK